VVRKPTFTARSRILKEDTNGKGAAKIDIYHKKPSLQNEKALVGIPAGIAAALAAPSLAIAKGGEFGALEGGIPALLHPIAMVSLYLTTLYTGYLGWQHRRTRTIAEEISALKATAPVLVSGAKLSSPVGALIDDLKKDLGTADESKKSLLEKDIAALQAYAVTEQQVVSLSNERKELIKQDFRDRHFQLSSLLLAAGVFFAIEGPVNTWMRTGKLFPGPHLFAGAGIAVLWALAASLVPAMQKGNKTAKDLHIALNAGNVGLFSWQILTGIPIVQKVLEIKFGIKL